MKLNNEYIEKLKNVDLEWDFEYFEFLDGDVEPGIYFNCFNIFSIVGIPSGLR